MGWRSLFGAKSRSPQSAARLAPADLLAALSAAGLDWSRSVESLFLQHGAAPCQSGQAVFLPPTTVLTPFPVTFHVRVPGELDLFPPRSYTAEIDPHGEAIRNFRTVVAALTAWLGRPCRRNWSANVDERCWTSGTLEVSVVAFPPRRNPPGTHPAVRLTITSAVPHHPPDESLRAVRGLPPGDRLDWSPLPPAPWAWPLRRENFAARPNPTGCFDDVDDDRPLVWRDPSAGRIGVSGRTVSLVLERERAVGLEQQNRSPGRTGEGLRTLDVVVAPRIAPRGLVPLVRVDWSRDLAPLATALAGFWNLPLATVAGMND